MFVICQPGSACLEVALFVTSSLLLCSGASHKYVGAGEAISTLGKRKVPDASREARRPRPHGARSPRAGATMGRIPGLPLSVACAPEPASDLLDLVREVRGLILVSQGPHRSPMFVPATVKSLWKIF
jgi:hypothetical protein